jgi:hypothetical protein
MFCLCVFFTAASQEKPIHFAVTRYISETNVKTILDSNNSFYRPFQTRIEESIKSSGLDWQRVDPSIEDRIARAFRQLLSQDNDPIDTLPYSVWDLCDAASIEYLVTFYLYNDDDDRVANAVVAGLSYVAPIVQTTMKEELSDEDINYYAGIYRIKGNRSVYHYREDIDDLLEKTSDGRRCRRCFRKNCL